MKIVDLGTIIDYISDGVMQIDAEGRIVYCNKNTAILDEITIEDSVGKYLLEVYPSLNPETSTLLKVLHTGTPMLNVEQSFNNYRGIGITTVNSTLPIFEKGEIVGAIEISRNITAVKRLSEKIVDLQSLVLKKKQDHETKKHDEAPYHFDDIVTQNKDMIRLKSMAMKAALTSTPVLVTGETGSGKELFVQAIHNAGPRHGKSFIAQNCAALPTTLLEGILFGTTKGSFTGAEDRPGLFELADGGTLFLDEIQSMPIELQAKLLRFLQDGWLRRVGDSISRKVDVRIIAALNIQPAQAVEQNLLREDLYYRLNTITLNLPPLRERRDDIMLLTHFFIQKYNRKYYRSISNVSDTVRDLFMVYNWKGNVRELEHVVEGAIHMMDGTVITIEDLPVGLAKQYDVLAEAIALKEKSLEIQMDTYERQLVEMVFSSCSQNVTHAAKRLGIPRSTLQRKLKKYGLSNHL
jgi:arginine utilization regulatory protein